MITINKNVFRFLWCFVFITLLYSCGVSKSIHDIPDITQFPVHNHERVKVNDSTFYAGNNFLTKNQYGLWELYVEGNPYQLGLNTGLLTQELFEKQEDAFLSKVEQIVPSKFKQKLLQKFLAWYNRKMYLNIPNDYKAEIFGLSKYASDRYDYVAENYLRVLYLHGAHDIGHALQDLALVGCSSFAVWNNKTEDGDIILGRNFDFYAGDEFAKNKIIAFVNPNQGHKFMSITWAGMIGVVSGMNEHGLTVTINAGKSKIPLVAKTPISILTREILQYATNIEEAIAIAKTKEVFVSESIMVGSAKDNKAILIEVSPDNFGVYEIENSSQLICANHFQSASYKDDENNTKHIKESHSKYRFDRMQELLEDSEKITPEKAIEILRNRKGLNNKAIGYGNEKSLNQLLAHHGIVFKPKDKLVWISSSPYQLGEFVAYDLNKIFGNPDYSTSLSEHQLLVEADPFLKTEAYQNYEDYRVLERAIEAAINTKKQLPTDKLKALKLKNPDYWKANYLIGKYYYQKNYYKAALIEFKEALSKEVTTVPDEVAIKAYIKKIKRKLN
ncbi:C45 family autoproteolytic acyltransferase/hydolase [Seonamhaeicola marinus]|uniref:Acyl-CoA--6-aminopenicillanic acid acyl-transferase n=1 Tax=Seonamhaeicola marinus TaxID=1912246 RepID=A0A5D0HUZ7_9FLAO|nr:C45 family peptidase [Seonamhaeicola marinus]TYA73967.1 acyl-CoA--6-aminopenicillanic acid acyl-transferase [Seonamhaeicola marinus]